MEIVFLTNEYPPHVYGGAGVHVEYLSRELARLDGGTHRVNIFCFGEQKGSSDGIAVRGMNPDGDFSSRNLRHPKLLDTLFRNVLMTGSVDKADIVHCHTWYTYLAGCVIKEMLGVPLVLTTHSLEPQRPWKEEQLGPAYQASRWLEKTAYENAEGVIATSESMQRAVHDLYRVPFEKTGIIPNGIDTHEYKPSFDSKVLSLYGINPDKPFILFVGRTSRQKGILHLVNAIRYLSPGIQVVLCAGAPDTKEIGTEMAERVKQAQTKTENEVVWIEQWVPRTHVITLFSHASVFVCPSIYEPFGIINLEAMACGIPVVASSVGGIPDVVVHRETGLLVPFETVDATNPEPKHPEQFSKDLAASVNHLLHAPEERRRMGQRSRERVDDHFSWGSVARRTLRFYEEVIRLRRRPRPWPWRNA